MKKKIFGVAIIAAMAVAASWSFSQSQNNKNNISLISTDIESMAACESIGWGDNDGNCVKNDAGTYFCKSDSWPALTDCEQ